MGPGQKIMAPAGVETGEYGYRAQRRIDYMEIMQKKRDAELAKMRDAQDMEAARQSVFGDKSAELSTGKPATNQYAAAATAAQGAVNSMGGGSETANVASAGLGGAASGAALGATMGASGGPIGAAIGAGVGITGALLSQRAAEKRRKAEAQGEAILGAAAVEERTEVARQNSMTNMVAALRSAFLRG